MCVSYNYRIRQQCLHWHVVYLRRLQIYIYTILCRYFSRYRLVLLLLLYYYFRHWFICTAPIVSRTTIFTNITAVAFEEAPMAKFNIIIDFGPIREQCYTNNNTYCRNLIYDVNTKQVRESHSKRVLQLISFSRVE